MPGIPDADKPAACCAQRKRSSPGCTSPRPCARRRRRAPCRSSPTWAAARSRAPCLRRYLPAPTGRCLSSPRLASLRTAPWSSRSPSGSRSRLRGRCRRSAPDTRRCSGTRRGTRPTGTAPAGWSIRAAGADARPGPSSECARPFRRPSCPTPRTRPIAGRAP